MVYLNLSSLFTSSQAQFFQCVIKMLLLKVFVVPFLGVVHGSTVSKFPKSPGSRIIDGEHADQGRFPFMAFIVHYAPQKQRTCGGSIISERHILTVASCTFEYKRHFHILFNHKSDFSFLPENTKFKFIQEVSIVKVVLYLMQMLPMISSIMNCMILLLKGMILP